MKYLKKFNEGVSTKRVHILKEILANTGWEQVKPEQEHWDYQLEYNLTDNVKIQLINFDNKDDFNYYLVSDDDFNFVSSYKDNYTQLYSDSPYSNLSDYDRMMKICNYLLPFFEKKPDGELIEDIKDCFIEIEDMFDGDYEVEWGYKNDSWWGFFPAYRFSDKLGLFFNYNIDLGDNDDLRNKIYELFEEGKIKLNHFDIDPTRASLVEKNCNGFVIEIIF